GRVRDRLRIGPAGRCAADRAEPVPAVLPVRARDPHAARPAGRPLHAGRGPGGTGMRRTRTTVPLAFPLALVIATGILGTFFERSTEIYFINALVSVSMVVALYVFVGNSGVLSFGHMSFVAIGAWTAGGRDARVEERPATRRSRYGFLGDSTVGNIPSLLLAALVGGVFALVAGLPLMRLSGLRAGLAPCVVLSSTNKIR